MWVIGLDSYSQLRESGLMPTPIGAPGRTAPPGTRISAGTLVRQISPGITVESLPQDLAQHQASYKELARRIRGALLDGRLAVDTGLPSERELAVKSGLSRTTVAAAYSLLRDEGWLRSVRGSGSRLTHARSPEVSPNRTYGPWGKVEDLEPDVIDLTTASLPAPGPEISAAVADAAQDLIGYLTGDGYHPLGLMPLREVIAMRFTAAGLLTSPEEILITNGAQHAWSIIVNELSAPGDRVLLECPTYPLAIDAVRNSRRVPTPVAVQAESDQPWDLDLFDASIRQTSPRLAYLVPDFHNPTGALMDTGTREGLVRRCTGTSTLIVVDESLREVPFPGTELPPSLAAFDRRSQVLTIGSVSKALWGGLRVGWIRTTRAMVNRLGSARALGDMAGSVLDQLVVARLLADPDAALHIQRDRLQNGCRELLQALDSALPQWSPTKPRGGASLWVRLPGPYAMDLARIAPTVGLHIVPGPRFGPDGTMDSYLRLPFTAHPQVLVSAVGRLAGIDLAAASARPVLPDRWMT